MQRTHPLSCPGRVFLRAPLAVLHLHTIYTARLVFPVARPGPGSAFFSPHPTNFIMCDVESSIRICLWTLTVRTEQAPLKEDERQ